MQHISERLVPTRVITKVTCDLCGKDCREAEFEVNRVEVEHSYGEAYPDGGTTTKVEFDLCGACFTEKLRPFLESLGARPRVTEVDY